jgi:hypothetical protein
MSCELCKYQVKSHLRLRPFDRIWRDLLKTIIKKLRKDKLLVLKFLLYTAYVFLSARKAINCFRMLYQQLRQRRHSVSLKVLSVVYLVFIIVQLFMIYTSEATQIYRKVRLRLKLICYEMTFINRT